MAKAAEAGAKAGWPVVVELAAAMARYQEGMVVGAVKAGAQAEAVTAAESRCRQAAPSRTGNRSTPGSRCTCAQRLVHQLL